MTQQSYCWAYTLRKPELKETCTPLFIAALFTIVRTCKQSKLSIGRWMDKEVVVHIYKGIFSSVQFSSVQSLSCVQLFATSWTTACQASLSITNSWSLPKLMPIESVMPSNHLILGQPLLLLPSIFLSIRVFFNEWVFHIRLPKYWSFSFSISPSNEYSGLISFRMDWLDLLAVQGAQEFSPIPQFKNISSSVLSLLYDSILTWLLEKI